MSSPIQKPINYAVDLSVVLERTIGFLATVDIVLEEYDSCLRNNKLLGVKHVSTLFR